MSITLFLDKRTQNADGQHPIKISVYYKNHQRLFSTKQFVSEDEWNEFQNSKKSHLMRKKKKVEKFREKAVAVLDDLHLNDNFSWEKFKLRLEIGEWAWSHNHILINDLYENKIKTSRYKTQRWYRTSLNALIRFFQRDKIYVSQITSDFPNKFMQYHLNQGNTITTVYTYLRPLDTLLKQEIKNGRIDKKFYPFGKDKFAIGTNHSKESALLSDEIGKLWKYCAETQKEQKALDFWLFAFLTAMSPVDICKLTKKNMVGSSIIQYSRSKTAKATREPVLVNIFRSKEINDVIRRQGNKKWNPYIFPILVEGLSDEEQSKKVDNFCNTQWLVLNEIKNKLKLESSLSLYTARHSFADNLAFADVGDKKTSSLMGQRVSSMSRRYGGKQRVSASQEAQSILLKVLKKRN